MLFVLLPISARSAEGADEGLWEAVTVQVTDEGDVAPDLRASRLAGGG